MEIIMSDAPTAPAPEPVLPAGRPGLGQLIVTIGSIGLTVLMIGALVFFAIPPEYRDMFNIALGAVLGWTTAVVSYHISSSAVAAAKDAAMGRIGGAAAMILPLRLGSRGPDVKRPQLLLGRSIQMRVSAPRPKLR
jgi:hypothetical protein